MTKKTISDFEDSIAETKDVFLDSFKEMLILVKKSDVTSELIQNKLNELHSKGVKYFNLFGRSLNEYDSKYFNHNKNIKNSKIDDAINISNTIIKYWNLLKSLDNKYELLIPKPSERAYASIQLFLKTFDVKTAKEFKLKYEKANLPISGFESSHKFIDMTKNQQISYGIIIGTFFLIILIIISIFIDCPTSSQNKIFTTVLALSAASFSASIPGFINVKYRNLITASGALAVFVIVFLLKPTELSDFKSCQENIKGTVYYGENPMESVDIMFIRQNKSTTTDNFGNFNIPFNLSSISRTLKVKLKKDEIQLDTVISIEKSNITEYIDFHTNKKCIHCVQKDSLGHIILKKRKCSASSKYILDYIEGFKRAGKDQGRITEFKYE